MPKILVCGEESAAFAAGLRKALRQQDPKAADAFGVVLANGFPLQTDFDAVVAGRGVRPRCGSRLQIVMAEGTGYAGNDGVITCGLGSACDFSFSSAAAGRLQICLSRPIRTCTGLLIDPCERSVRGTLGTADAALAAFALRICFDFDGKN